MKKIIHNFAHEIKQYFMTSEIVKMFKSNKRLLLFLIENDILTIGKDDDIKSDLNTTKYETSNYLAYLIPEKLHETGQIQYLDENYKEKQKIGENDDYICQIIRKDLIDEFISFMNKELCSVNSVIKESIY